MVWEPDTRSVPQLKRRIREREIFHLTRGDPIIEELGFMPVTTIRESHHYVLLKSPDGEYWICPRHEEEVFFLPINEKNAHQALEGRRLGNIVAEEMPDPNP